MAAVRLSVADARVRAAVTTALDAAGHAVDTGWRDAADAAVWVVHEEPGLAHLRRLRERRADAVSVVLLDFSCAARAVEAVRLGAVAVLPLPLRAGALAPAVSRAAQLHALVAGTGVLGGVLDGGGDGVLEAQPPEAPARFAEPPAVAAPASTLAEALRGPERDLIHAALEAEGWNRSATARRLGIDRTTLYKKIRSFGLDTPID